MKKILLLTLGILLSLPAVAQNFTYEYEGQTLKYSVFRGKCTLVGPEDKSISGPLTIPATVTYESVEYTVTSISSGAFQECSNLTSVEIPNSVTTIGNSAFSYCMNLTSVNIPNSVTEIGNSAFSDCYRLTSVNIPNSVTKIRGSAFYNCTSLTSVNIPNSVTKIDLFTFYYCFRLTSVVIPNSVTSIGDEAFAYCGNLESVNLPNSIITLRQHAFYECDKLKSVTIPASVTEIENGVFSGCDALQSINVENDNPNYTSIDGVLFNKDVTALIGYPGNLYGSYTIPGSVTTIGGEAFSGCQNLTSVTLPNSITSIGYYAFSHCLNLKSVNIPNSVTEIGSHAFQRCRLSTVDIPASVTSIESGAFCFCPILQAINVDKSNPNYISINGVLFNKDVTTLKQYPGGLAGSYTIPNSVTEIGNNAFYGCSNLISINIPNSVTRIGFKSFSDCLSLSSVTIPASVVAIDYNGFYGCTALTSVFYNNDDVKPLQYVNSETFSPETYSTATLYVPEASVNNCRQINPWMYFNNIQAFDFNGIEDVVGDIDAMLPCEIYNLSGVKVADTTEGLNAGLYIVRQGSTVKKISVK